MSTPTAVFYPEFLGAIQVRAMRQAVAVCAGCPVIIECRTWALRTREPHGVWGGMTPGERRKIRRPVLS